MWYMRSLVGETGKPAGIFFVARYSGSGRRPRWVAIGMLFLAIAAALSAAHELFAPAADSSLLFGGDRGGHTRKRIGH